MKNHPDRTRWNKKYRERIISDFSPSALFSAFSETIPPGAIPPGDVLELACGASGTALALASQGRQIMAVDVSDVGLALLAEEIEKHDLVGKIQLVQDDLVTWSPPRGDFALVICSFYWDRIVFGYAHELVMPGGYIAWEGFSPACVKYRSASPYAMQEEEPLALLPKSFAVIECRDVDDGKSIVSRRLIAKREA
nr:MAG: Methyltransferase domain-containing protein [Candidatus Kentron sp. TUN]VFK69678.1 MAG: Methyltransferase domain-containing protein [Candidatus Kentron sp. TUN]